MLMGCATQEQTSAVECGGGSALGAVLLCKLAGGNNGTCAAIAAGAAAAGAAICYSYASKIQKHRRELVGHEQDLDARIKYLREVNQETVELNRQLATKVDSVTRSTDQVVDIIARGQVTQAQVDHQRQALDKEVKAAQGQVNTVAQELQSAQQFRAQLKSGSSADLDTEIARLQDLLSQAQRSSNVIAAQGMRI
jgi:hypothetical protein